MEIADLYMEGIVEYAEIIPEVKEVEPYDYWKERCLAAEKFIDLLPDPELHGNQLDAHSEWISIILKENKL